jgi:ketosteroid isomerase-like protein
MKNTAYLIALSLIIFIANCSPTFDLESEQAKLIQADKEWSEAARTNNMERLWSFWTDDAKILLSADKTISGLEEIKQFTTKARTDPNFVLSWEVQGAEISKSGKMGYTYGIGKVTRTGESGELVSDENPYLIVWEKQLNGNWKCIIEN